MQDRPLLLLSNKVNINSEEKIPNKEFLNYQLTTLYKQTPNHNFLFIPREAIYATVQDTSGRVKRWLKFKLGEVPVIYDAKKSEETVASMRNFMISRGYYEAKVEVEDRTTRSNKGKKVIYHVVPQQQYTVDTLIFVSRDSVIEAILKKTAASSFLKKGEPGSLDLYNKEVGRILNYLRNNGYATFNGSYIAPLKADSSDYKLTLRLEILLSKDNALHKRYRTGNIEVFPAYEPLDSLIILKEGFVPPYIPDSNYVHLKDTTIQGVRFFLPNWSSNVKPQTLRNEIALKSGEYFNQSDEILTNNNISSLGLFRFISIKSEIDSLQDSIIHYKIYLTRNERFEFGANIEGSYSDQTVSQTKRLNLIGASGSISLQIRNALKGAETLSNSLSAGVEFDIPDSLNTIDFRVQEQLNIPRFVDYLGFWKLFQKKNDPENLYEFFKLRASTRVNLAYNYTDRAQFYSYQSLNASFGYNTQLGSKHSVSLNHAGIDYFLPSLDQGTSFDTLVNRNPFLTNSFGNQFFTGFLVRDINYFYNYRTNRYGRGYYGNVKLEFSGAEVEALNALYNSFALIPKTFTLGNIDFSRFIKLDMEGRFYKTFAPHHALVFRLSTGLGVPFGRSEEVPYVKQFYVGGPNSIRAFRAREPGPGSHCTPTLFAELCGTDTSALNTPFYQTGNIKLEANVEYRFGLVKVFNYVIEGALFLDAGNVWTSSLDSTRVGSQFLWNAAKDEQGEVINPAFYQQLAIGTGFGLRLDFSYFLLRFDMGYPLRTPYQNVNPWANQLKASDINYNLAIGYPF
ncbi:MAG: BamA/TamA family outer membrane protein [Saprospiraceae bacterium]|nr:BamA/TamA family outer membrane protein [Saprospiraceae bacterium]